MSTTLVSDLYVPTVAMEYARQAFTTSLEMFSGFMGAAMNMPIQLINPDELTQGGQFIDVPVYKRIASLITRRDLTSVAAITGLKLEGANDIGVLINKKVGHVEYTPDAEFISKARAGDISREVGMQAGEQAAAVIQSSVIAAAIGCLDAMTSTLHTTTPWVTSGTRANLSPNVLIDMINLMGDFQSKITHFLMRSESQTDLFKDAVGRSFTGVGDQALQGDRGRNTIGRNWAVVDDSNLTVADGGFDKYITLGFGARAIRVMIVRPLFFYPEITYVNTEQVTRHIRADFDYAIQVPGFKYNTTANPTDGTLATSGSWTPQYTSAKEVNMVKGVHNYSAN